MLYRNKYLFVLLIVMNILAGCSGCATSALQEAKTDSQKWYAAISSFRILQTQALNYASSENADPKIIHKLAQISDSTTDVINEVEKIRITTNNFNYSSEIIRISSYISAMTEILKEVIPNE